MEARTFRIAMFVAMLTAFGPAKLHAANFRSQNFIITAPTVEFAQTVGRAAEKFRRELAIEWLGKEIGRWQRPCPIAVEVGPQMGAGGKTSFLFDNGRAYGWQMTIQGSRERIIDSVLPHEITHTIFATHFGQPLPRWADEGACTTVEHSSERDKQQRMLIQFLKTRRGIPFDRMFAMTEYPSDVMPLYAQGYSTARFLIALRGQRQFVKFVGAGLQSNDWISSLNLHYGIKDLGSFQNSWLDWVKAGSNTQLASRYVPGRLVSTAGDPKKRRPDSNIIYRAQSDDRPRRSPGERSRATLASTKTAIAVKSTGHDPDGWQGDNQKTAPARQDLANLYPEHPVTKIASNTRGLRHEAVRQQPICKTRQIVLEWERKTPQRSAKDRNLGRVTQADNRRGTGVLR